MSLSLFFSILTASTPSIFSLFENCSSKVFSLFFSVFSTGNDDINFSDLKNLELSVEILNSKNQLLMSQTQKLTDVDYFSVEDWPLKIKIPKLNIDKIVKAKIKFTLLTNDEKISENSYSIRIADYK